MTLHDAGDLLPRPVPPLPMHGVPARTAVIRTAILHAYGFDSIRIVFPRGEIFQTTGNSPGNPTRRILVCEVLDLKMTVSAWSFFDAQLTDVYNSVIMLRHDAGPIGLE